MGREKQGYRDTIAELNRLFPEKGKLTRREDAASGNRRHQREDLIMSKEDKERIDQILSEVDGDLLRETTKTIGAALTGKGLSYRQAEAVLELMKDLLKNATI